MSAVRKVWNKWVLAGGAGLAALVAANRAIARRAGEPDQTEMMGEPAVFEWKHGRIAYRVAGPQQAPPLVLVHGIGPGASSYMWRRNIGALSTDFRVYAFDLLGFGFSDKSANAPYAADLYVELIADFLREVVAQPAHLIASSLSAAYAVRVADEYPELIRSLVLVAPTITDMSRARPGMTNAAFYGLLHSPVLGTSFYNAMASERSIRDYARKQLFYDRRFVTDALVAHLYAMSHQPGAQYAATAFLSSYLNTEAREAFARLTQPVLLVWGKQDHLNPPEQAAELLPLNPQAHLELFDYCRMMPQEEHAERFNALVRQTLLA